MKEEIEKLMSEYDLKIENCDILIEHISDSIRKYRSETNKGIVNSFRKDRAIEQSKRQAYVQAKYDFDGLLDHV